MVEIFYVISAISIISASAIIFQVYAQISDVDDTISTTDKRKSFGYCPDYTTLDKYGVTYTIESCPLSRLYVDNWDKLDNVTKSAIHTELSNNGWKIENE